MKMLYSEAFRRYGASPKNANWSICAENDEGELIVSLWSHMFCDKSGNTIKYKDRVSRWSGLGNKEFRVALDKAQKIGQKIRVVISKTSDPKAVDAGVDASKLKNTFGVRETWLGKLVLWDGDNFEILFTDTK